MVQKSFNIRSFLSIGTFLFLILLAVSGIALHFLEYKPTFALVYFKSSHTIFGLVFLLFAAGHLWKNWSAIKAYMSGKAKKIVSKEMLISLIILIVILLITLIKAIGMAKGHGVWE